MKFFIHLCLLLSLSSIVAAETSKHRAIDYSEINGMVTLFETKVRSPYVYYRSYLSIKDSSLDPDSIKLWLTENGNKIQDIAITLDKESGEYLIQLPRFTEDRANDIELYINQPKEALGLSINTGVRAPSDSIVSYNDLMVVLDDFNEFASEMAGAMSWFVPDMDQLKFVFESPATITLTTANYEKVFNTDDEHAIIIERTRKMSKLNPQVSFSTTPKMMIPED